MWPNVGLLGQIASATASSTSNVVSPVIVTLFSSFFNLLYTILPYAIGILIFIIGYMWARRSLGGR